MTKDSGAGIIEDLGPDAQEPNNSSPGLTTIILGILLAVISVLFLYLLNTKTGAPFGLTQVLYSIVIGIIATFFFYWLNLLMRNNAYMGMIIGIAALGASVYALFVKYSGPYTTTFAIILSIIVLIYLFIQFFKTKKN